MACVPLVNNMSDDDTPSGGPNLTPIDQHILEMLSEEQWTTGAIIDTANDRVRGGELQPEGVDVESISDDEQPVSRAKVNDGLKVFKRLGAIEYAHEPTSLYRLVWDPREATQCTTESDTS